MAASRPAAAGQRVIWRLATLSLALGWLCAGCPAPTYLPTPGEWFQSTDGRDSPLDSPANDGATVVAEPPVRQPVFGSLPRASGSHAPSIIALPDGELLVAWYSYVGPSELDGAAIYAARRPAGQTAWDPPELLVNGTAADGNPVLYAENDRVWFFWSVSPGTGWSLAHVEWRQSDDGGRTWSPSRSLPGGSGTMVRSPPVRAADAVLVLPAYDDLWQRSLFYRSADGDDWSLSQTLAAAPPHQAIQPAVAAVGGDGLLAVMRNTGGGWLWFATSDDNGRSWSDPRNSGLPNPASPAALLRMASGSLLLVFNDSPDARSPLSAVISDDGGWTWSRPQVLVDGPGEYAYPAVAQTPDRGIHVVYSHDRLRIEHLVLTEQWLRASGQ